MKKIPKRKKVYKVRTKKAEKGIKQRNFETWTKFPDYEKKKNTVIVGYLMIRKYQAMKSCSFQQRKEKYILM